MKAIRFITAVFFIILTFNYSDSVKAQDTFGPTCDGVTVTCVPTNTPTAGPSPTPSNTPTPTDTPSPTTPPPSPTPTGLPRAGSMGPVNFVFLISSTLIAAGIILKGRGQNILF